MNKNRMILIGAIAVIAIGGIIYYLMGRTTPREPHAEDDPVEQIPPGSDAEPKNPDEGSNSGNGSNQNNLNSGAGDNKTTDLTSIVFYEGNGCDQDIVATYKKNMSGRITVNDEARSMKLNDVPAGTIIAIYDDKEGKETDDFSVLRVKKRTFNSCISTFEASPFNDTYEMIYNEKNGLDGKVSFIKITFP